MSSPNSMNCSKLGVNGGHSPTLAGADQASEKGGVEIEKVLMVFGTLESGELHNICFFIIL